MPTVPPTQPSIKVIHSFSYLGNTKLWSCRYFFTGGNPTGTSMWNNIVSAIQSNEQIKISPAATITEFVGYNSGSEVPVYSKAVSLPGLSVPGSAHSAAPGDCCAVVKYTTTQRTVKNHPIYLYNYIHSVWIDEAISPDTLHGDQKNSINNYAQGWVTGFTADGILRQRCGPRGAVAQSRIVNPYIRHRDFL